MFELIVDEGDEEKERFGDSKDRIVSKRIEKTVIGVER